MSEADELLSTAAAARVIGVHPQTLRSYERDGLIEAVRTPGNQRRFRLGDLQQLLRDDQEPKAS
jgi:MerR family transcriptional regulator/heat shock protein HspR